MSQIVFVSLFLGLVAGLQPVDLHVGPDVNHVRVLVDTREVASIVHPPWQAVIDLGSEILPHEISAIALDKNDREIGRVSQIVNLPRPLAEAVIEVKNEGGRPAWVEVIGRHRQFALAKSAAVQVDGKSLRVDRAFKARLPKLDWSRPHVISAEVRFVERTVARSELVLSGNAYTSGSELTPVAVRRTADHLGSLDGCFSASGVALRTAAVERTNALVVLVKDPDPRTADAAVDLMYDFAPRTKADALQTELDRESTLRIVWPISQRFRAEKAESILFEKSDDLTGAKASFTTALVTGFPYMTAYGRPKAFADAVAVAALQAMAPARRRAVVVLLSDEPDASFHKPAVVRRYLASVGVPLFVWSLTGPRPDVAESWGPVEDISTRDKLHDAVANLRRVLDEQAIVWLPADPLTALRAEAKDSCGVATLASGLRP